MALYCSSSLLLFVSASVVVLLSPCNASYDPEVIYMYCSTLTYISKDMIIRMPYPQNIDNPSNISDNYPCKMTLMPTDYGTRLMARFLKYRMDPGFVHEYGTCAQEGVLLQSQNTDYFGPGGYCRSGKPDGTFDLGSEGVFGYQKSSGLGLTPSVDLLVTEITDKTDYSECPSGYFDCHWNNHCIDEELTCNGYDDCGNGRDEIEGCELSLALIEEIVIGSVLFVILVVVLIAFFIRRRRRRDQYIQYR